MRRFVLASLLGVVAITVGCLGRTGIGVDELDSVESDDAAVDSGLVIVNDATPDTAQPPEDTRADSRRDTYIDIWEVFPIPDSGPIGVCASCVRDMCGAQVNACVNSPECRAGLACTTTKCLGGIAGGGGGGTGGFDLKCITDCFGGDLSKAFQAINMFTCITGKCGEKCGGLTGGIPGFPGSGGSGGSGGGAKFEFTPEEMSRLPMSTTFKFSPEALAPWHHEILTSACEQGLASCTP